MLSKNVKKSKGLNVAYVMHNKKKKLETKVHVLFILCTCTYLNNIFSIRSDESNYK